MKRLVIVGRLLAFIIFLIGLLFLLFNPFIGLLIIIASIVVWNICGHYLAKERSLEEDEAERAKKYLESKGMVSTEHELRERKYTSSKQSKNPVQRKKEKPKDKISQIEKEHIMVKNVTTDDMRKLDMPFVCNTEVKKYIHEGGHPFAYMEILGENIILVKAEIRKMNEIIKESIKAYPSIPQDLRIPENEIVFQSQNYGYTRIMCTPKTFTGRPSKYPYSLFFCTDLSKSGNTRHGELTYGKDGTIQKATVCFWENSNGFFLNFKMIDGELTFTGLGQNKQGW